MSKLLSIIIPVYNVEDYVGECLDSLVGQDLTDCEVVVVNDGSTDNSLYVVNKYKDLVSALKIISQPNKGLSAARNIGVFHSSGDYIYFLDSDDYLESFAISEIKKTISIDRDIDVFQMDNIVSNLGKRLNYFHADSIRMSITDYFKLYHTVDNNSVVSACSFIYSSKFWHTNKLRFEEGKRYEDQLFLYNLLTKKGIIRTIHIDRPFYVFRENREGSISTNVTLVHYQDRQYIWRKAFQIFEDQKLNDKVYFNNLFKYCHWVLYEAYNIGYIDQYSAFFSKYDIQIMRQGITNYFERKIWLLLCINPLLMLKYIDNKYSSITRRIVNVCFSLFDKIFPYWLVK